jgi:hypothetical protein
MRGRERGIISCDAIIQISGFLNRQKHTTLTLTLTPLLLLYPRIGPHISLQQNRQTDPGNI